MTLDRFAYLFATRVRWMALHKDLCKGNKEHEIDEPVIRANLIRSVERRPATEPPSWLGSR